MRETVLDLGSTSEFCRGEGWKGEYTGIDISSGMVKATRSRLNTKNIFQLDFLEEHYDGRHDVVVCVSALQEKPLDIEFMENVWEKII